MHCSAVHLRMPFPQCKVLDADNYVNPSFGPFFGSKHTFTHSPNGIGKQKRLPSSSPKIGMCTQCTNIPFVAHSLQPSTTQKTPQACGLAYAFDRATRTLRRLRCSAQPPQLWQVHYNLFRPLLPGILHLLIKLIPTFMGVGGIMDAIRP